MELKQFMLVFQFVQGTEPDFGPEQAWALLADTVPPVPVREAELWEVYRTDDSGNELYDCVINNITLEAGRAVTRAAEDRPELWARLLFSRPVMEGNTMLAEQNGVFLGSVAGDGTVSGGGEGCLAMPAFRGAAPGKKQKRERILLAALPIHAVSARENVKEMMLGATGMNGRFLLKPLPLYAEEEGKTETLLCALDGWDGGAEGIALTERAISAATKEQDLIVLCAPETDAESVGFLMESAKKRRIPIVRIDPEDGRSIREKAAEAFQTQTKAGKRA